VSGGGDEGAGRVVRGRRADGRRRQEALLDAAAAVFEESGGKAPVRDIEQGPTP
jgi:AcrR family transcriptional regulator